MNSLIHRVLATALLAVALAGGRAEAQTVNRDDILYILPYWFPFGNATDEAITSEIARLHSRLGPDGTHLKLGFSVYIFVSMDSWSVDASDPAAIRASLGGTISQINAYIERARAHNIPIALAFQTAIRERYDLAQTASEAEDVRSMMWYADNELAAGWWTHTRYARKQQAIQEAYIRELGKIVAERMRLYPDTLVAASGDGEQELAFARNTNIYADYSPFAVAEFRDWLRLGGLYATGAAFAGQGYSLGSRYAGDLKPGEDTNLDGHTLNGDFGTVFQTWNLLHFDWNLADTFQAADPGAISLTAFNALGTKLPGTVAGGFDPPRVPKAVTAGDQWWDLWVLFKQTMLQRHNIEFAKWMTTSPDETGATIPRTRWYSNQIPADYLFNGSPQNPNERWHSSMSSWWTADVSPYGSLGITAFNVDHFNVASPYIAYTLRNVAPQIAGRGLRWGIVEWHPGQRPDPPGGFSDKLALYRSEMALIEQYRPSLLQPFHWGTTGPNQIEDTGFETAMKEMVARIKDGTAVTANPTALRFGAIANGATLQTVTSAQTVTVTFGLSRIAWTATSNQPWLQLTGGSGSAAGTFTAEVVPGSVPAGATNLTATITVTARGALNGPISLPVTLDVTQATSAAVPFGSFDTPLPGTTVAGSIAVTGWALDDIGVTRVEIWRDKVAGETTPGYGGPGPGNGKVFIANAFFVGGARTDVEAAYPAMPYAYRAGWGYLLLTQGLWNQGNGVFTLHAFAYDQDGHSATLGSKSITSSNATAFRPFGGIDSPGYGETVSGGFWNFGWALTPNATPSCMIGSNGVFVAIDSGPLMPVSYGDLRPDIAAAFPGFTNGAGAGGAFYIDTTTLTNGTHQIGWYVVDSCGRADGIGSRFFSVLNTGGNVTAAKARPAAFAPAEGRDPIRVKRNGDVFEWSYPNSDGTRIVRVEQNERVELHLPAGQGAGYRGYQVVNGARRELPLGSSLEASAGVFYWQPAAGFLGSHDLEFVSDPGAVLTRVRVVVGPPVRQMIDAPQAGSTVSPAFAVAGWVLDLAAESGTGVDTVHVWAYTVGGTGQNRAPIFLGAADYGGMRPDVAAVYGKAFEASGYDLAVSGLAPGTYDLVVYARRAETGTFDAAQVVRLSVR